MRVTDPNTRPIVYSKIENIGFDELYAEFGYCSVCGSYILANSKYCQTCGSTIYGGHNES